MTNPNKHFIPLAVPDLTGREREYLNKCIDTTFVSSVGEFVTRFEEMGARLSNADYGVATSSGTTGLHLALMTVGVKPGDIVIIPSFTFIATANAVAHCGAIPWVMDIDEETWCIDADMLEKEIERETVFSDFSDEKKKTLIHKGTGRRVAALMPVYTIGNFPDMNKVRNISDKYGLPLIADAACAIGAEYEGKKIGELADLSVFSFNGNKTLTAGGGGLVIGNDEDALQKARHISTTARVGVEYDFDMVGYNYRMTNIQAAVGCAQLERLDELVEKKRRIRRHYYNELSYVQGLRTFPTPKGQSPGCWMSGIVLDSVGGSDENQEKVRALCGKLKEEGIEARSFWKPVHHQEPYKDCIKSECLQVTDDLWKRVVLLPCSTNVKEEEIDKTCHCVKSIDIGKIGKTL